MKILVISPSLHRGGAERVVSLLSQEWAKKHEVKIAVFEASSLAYPYSGQLVDLELPSLAGWPSKGIQGMRRVLRLARCFKMEKPDRIITFMESANFPSILAALMTGRLASLWVSVHCDPARFPRSNRWLIPLLYSFPIKVVAVSQGVSLALEKMGVARNKLLFIPNPAPDISSLGGAFLPENTPARFLLAVGRLDMQKGFDLLLQAFAQLVDTSIHLVILGEGKERRNLELLAEELQIARRVRFPGNVDDPTPWYRAALAFVLSSRYEGWPNVLLETMANRCPVVSFDCNYGPSEIIEDGINGLLVKAGDVCGLAKMMTRLLSDNELRERFANQGVKRAAEFNVSRLAQYWVSED